MSNETARSQMMELLYALNNGRDTLADVLASDAYLAHMDTGAVAALTAAGDAVHALIARMDEAN